MSYSQQGGPTPRRSTRLSAPPSAASQSIANSAVTGSRRKVALPKARARQSQAYGSGSRAKAAEELTLHTTGFSQAFDRQRGDAVARDEDEQEEEDEVEDNHDPFRPLASPDSESQSWEPSSWQKDRHNQKTDHNESNGSPTPSNIDDSKSFGALRETGLLSGPPVRPNGISVVYQQRTRAFVEEPVREHVQQPSTSFNGVGGDTEQNQRPAWRKLLGDNINTFIDSRDRRFFYAILVPLVAVAFMFLLGSTISKAYIPATSTDIPDTASTGPSLSSAVSSRVAQQYSRLVSWIQPPAPVETPDELKFHICDHPSIECDERGEPAIKFDIVSRRIFGMETKLTQLSSGFQTFKDSMNRYEAQLPNYITVIRHKDGSVEIPDEFWRAISSKILFEDGSSGLQWDKFISKNDAKIEELRAQFVPRKELKMLMEEHYLKYSDRIDNTYLQLKNTLADEIKAVTKKEARSAVLDKLRLQSLAVTNLIANAELNLRKVNYFSTGLAARIDPRTTSSTSPDQNKILTSIYRSTFRTRSRHPPIVALERWDEPGQAWCSAVDRKLKSGRAQLGVILGSPVYPTQVTIEHLPKEASPGKNVATAPKSVELWVELADPSQRQSPACSGDGPKGYVCLGEFTYDIEGSNHIQTFNLDTVALSPITRAVIRVNTNWGGDHTCLYRVRLHGESPEVAGEEASSARW